jgi:zinc protease
MSAARIAIAAAIAAVFCGCSGNVERTQAAAGSPLDTQPVVPPAAPFVAPRANEVLLRNGMRLWLINAPKLPLVTVCATIPYGSGSDPKARDGLAALTCDAMLRGAGKLDALAFSDAVESLGASIQAQTRADASSITIDALAGKSAQAIELLALALRQPSFTDDEFLRLRSERQGAIRARRDDPVSVALLVAQRNLFGDDHPYGHPSQGYEATVAQADAAAARAWYQSHWRPDRITLIAIADLGDVHIAERLDKALSDWTAPAEAASRPAHAVPPKRRAQLIAVERPDAEQTAIVLATTAPARDASDEAALVLFTDLFGASFTSRLNRNLREDKGYAYGAWSMWRAWSGCGWFASCSTVQADATGASLREFIKEYARASDGQIDDDEASRARATAQNRFVSRFETQMTTAREFADLATHGLDPGHAAAVAAALPATSAKAIGASGARLVNSAEATIVLVGDRARIEKELEGLVELKLPKVVWYDAEGVAAGE